MRFPRARRRSLRRGAVYVFVLASAMVVAMVSMAVLAVAQINGRVVAQANDSAEAEVLAEAATEFALSAIASDANWRTDYPTSMPVGPLALGRGTISFSIADDAGGNLVSNPADPVRISGTGIVRGAKKVYSLRCASGGALSCLQVSAAFGGKISLTSMTLTGGSAVSLTSNALITPISATSVSFGMATTLQAPTTITTLLCSGTTPTTTSGTRSLPDPVHVFDYYKANGTQITIGSIPASGTLHTMQLALLSPGSNPYGGGTNAQGIYWIDCKSTEALQISNCRIVGTLVIFNPAATSGTINSNYFAPAVSNYPALLVQGNWSLGTVATNLADSAATGNATTPTINYNPANTPYNGVSDTTYTTTYPSRIDGIVYASGNLTGKNAPAVNGVLLAGGTFTQSSGSLTLTYNSAYYTNPPPGFTSSTIVPVPGSWKWEKAP